jgi:hypothetical protein
MRVWQIKLQVGKTDALGGDVSFWLDQEDVISLSVTPSNGGVAIESTQIIGNILIAYITGVSTGATDLIFNYTTATRERCFKGRVYVEDDCS